LSDPKKSYFEGAKTSPFNPRYRVYSYAEERLYSVVGKVTTFYLLPLPLPSTQQVDDIALPLKKGMVKRSIITTFDFGEVKVEGTMFLYKCKIPSFDIEIDKDRYRRPDL
jgi:hypothetical protein